jgi:hypothetical protein
MRLIDEQNVLFTCVFVTPGFGIGREKRMKANGRAVEQEATTQPCPIY